MRLLDVVMAYDRQWDYWLPMPVADGPPLPRGWGIYWPWYIPPESPDGGNGGSGMAAFPEARGFGAIAQGGRGGRIIDVTNLNDSGSGSLRAALESSGPRIVIFRVGGILRLRSQIRIRNPYLTVAGQTAPGGGILVTGWDESDFKNAQLLSVHTHDVILRYLRVRNIAAGPPGSGQQCISVATGARRVSIDHCSFSWNLDDNNIYATGPEGIEDVSIQQCIFSESLWPHSTGFFGGGRYDYLVSPPVQHQLGVRNVSLYRNLFAHNSQRHPNTSANGLEWVNNLVYNWRNDLGEITATALVDILNNLCTPGPMSRADHYTYEGARNVGQVNEEHFPPPLGILMRGNIVEGRWIDPRANNFEIKDGVALVFVASGEYANQLVPALWQRGIRLPQGPFPVVPYPALTLEDIVLSDVGANARLDELGKWVSNADAVDLRVIRSVRERTDWAGIAAGQPGVHDIPPTTPEEAGGFPVIDPGSPYQDSDGDGMPDAWEAAQGLDPYGSPDDAQVQDLDGVPVIEHFLNGTAPRL